MQLLEINNILELLYKYETAMDTNLQVFAQKKYQMYVYPDSYQLYNAMPRYTIRMKYEQFRLLTELQSFAVKITAYKQWRREVIRFQAISTIQDVLDLYRGSTMQDIAKKYRIRISDLLCS